jgi:hypothetical protein
VYVAAQYHKKNVRMQGRAAQEMPDFPLVKSGKNRGRESAPAMKNQHVHCNQEVLQTQ